jgi:alpha-D-ribose 1-methylphosphonate 5-triphosphate synthase subunit PhnH
MGRNRSVFPCGVDIFFTTPGKLAALPRSVRVTEAA